jgi:hypothetical protein
MKHKSSGLLAAMTLAALSAGLGVLDFSVPEIPASHPATDTPEYNESRKAAAQAKRDRKAAKKI